MEKDHPYYENITKVRIITLHTGVYSEIGFFFFGGGGQKKLQYYYPHGTPICFCPSPQKKWWKSLNMEGTFSFWFFPLFSISFHLCPIPPFVPSLFSFPLLKVRGRGIVSKNLGHMPPLPLSLNLPLHPYNVKISNEYGNMSQSYCIYIFV